MSSHYVKAKIPKALREQVWLKYVGPKFAHKCTIKWCANKMTVFDWEAGHNIPESKGGATNIDNLRPICGRCNKSMGNQYSIDDWNKLGPKAEKCAGCQKGCCAVM